MRWGANKVQPFHCRGWQFSANVSGFMTGLARCNSARVSQRRHFHIRLISRRWAAIQNRLINARLRKIASQVCARFGDRIDRFDLLTAQFVVHVRPILERLRRSGGVCRYRHVDHADDQPLIAVQFATNYLLQRPAVRSIQVGDIDIQCGVHVSIIAPSRKRRRAVSSDD